MNMNISVSSYAWHYCILIWKRKTFQRLKCSYYWNIHLI